MKRHAKAIEQNTTLHAITLRLWGINVGGKTKVALVKAVVDSLEELFNLACNNTDSAWC